MTNSNLIVVGVDGSEHSQRALRWACEEAAAHGRDVLAVTTWARLAVPYPWESSVDQLDKFRAMLEELADGARAEFPDVSIRTESTQGNAAERLIQLSEQADLVVVGAVGHGAFTGMLIGSVSQHVLSHSQCTVVVVR